MPTPEPQLPATPAWWQALNPAIYLISVLPGLGVWLLAGDVGESGFALLLATLAVVLLQHAINLLNDAADWRLGADQEKYDSWVRIHAGDLRAVARHGWLSLLAGGSLGVAVLIHQGMPWILYLALPMVVLGYLYNAGPRPLSYTHFGEWVTGLCYGPGVFGCLWLVSGQPWNSAASWGSLAFAALAMALLLSHQPPQVDTDRAAGKNSFAVRFGVRWTQRAALALFLLFLVSLSAARWSTDSSARLLLFSLSVTAVALMLSLGKAPNPKRILLPASGVLVVLLLFAHAPVFL